MLAAPTNMYTGSSTSGHSCAFIGLRNCRGGAIIFNLRRKLTRMLCHYQITVKSLHHTEVTKLLFSLTENGVIPVDSSVKFYDSCVVVPIYYFSGRFIYMCVYVHTHIHMFVCVNGIA